MADLKERRPLQIDPQEVIHALRTTVAATVSFLVARLCRMPESYWAVVATMIVTQSSLGAAWTISKDRLAGTALGAAAGALLATYAGHNLAAFAVGLFSLGLLCALLHIERSAYRYAGITLGVVMLVARTQPAWLIAIHRFVEISVGLAVGLIVTALWPESQPQSASQRR